MKKAVIAVALSVLVALLSANVNTVAHAQGNLVAPSNVAAQNTGNPGEVRISWDAAPDAAYYRIGWVAYSDVAPIIAAGGDWLEHFAFIDIENRDQSEHFITRLTPGVQYAFIMASNDGRYGTPRWPSSAGWAFLTLNEAPGTHASLGSTAINLTWDPVPGATYYRIGWVVYEDVAPIIASGGDWLEHFAFIDIANRGQTEHTIARLTPGLQYAFIVAGNDGRYGTPQWPPASAWQFMTPSVVQPTGPEADWAALITLYNATGGANWTNRSGWLTDAPMGEWDGVTTDESGRVVRLLLRENNLAGRIPVDVGNLTALTRLDFQGNELTGNIPSTLGNLSNLDWLELDHNQLTGQIPAQLRNLTNLRLMDLDNNRLDGPIPSWLGSMTGLEWLSIGSNPLGGSIPRELGNLTNLQVLWILDAQLTGTIPTELGNLDNLEILHLYGNQLTGTIPSSLGNLPDLVELNLSSNDLRGAIPPELGRLTKLTYMSLRSNGLTGPIPSELGNMSSLESLYLFENRLSGTIPTELENLSNLEGLVLHDNQLSGSVPAWLGNLSRLRSLNLSINGFTGEIPTELGQLSNLTYLNLRSNGLTGPVPTELGNLSNLEQLYLHENKLSGEMPESLGRLSNLKVLFLQANQLKGTVPSSLGSLKNLTHLSLRTNQLNGALPSSLGNLSNLELMNLGGNGFSGEIPESLGDLSNLDLLYLFNNALTGPIPDSLGSLTNLTRLSLANNQLMGDIPDELGNLTKLEIIRLAGNSLTGCVPAGLRSVATNDYTDLGLPFCGATPGASTNDREALVALYNATGGPNWTNRTNWLNDRPLNEWHGVITNADGRVVRIELDQNGLNGEFPAAVGDLTELTRLVLWGNVLEGPIPDDLSRLSSLRALDLGGNNLTGSLPLWLGGLSELTYLSLWGNEFTGSIPSGLADLADLKTLDMRENRLSGAIPAELSRLTNLETLYLSRNSLSGPIPSTVGNLSSLKRLWLSHNDFSGPIPSELGKLSNLERLWLTNNRLSGPLPAELANLTKLKVLYIIGNQLSGRIPTYLGSLSTLEELGLADNQLMGTIPSELASLASLEHIYLAGNELTGCIPQALLNTQENDLLALVLHACGSPQSESDEVRQFRDSEVRYLKWEVGPGVPGAHDDLVREGIIHLHRYAVPLGLPQLPDDATFYLYRDRELMAQTLARLERRPLESARESVSSGLWGGLAGLEDEDSGWIMVNLHTTGRRGASALIGVAAHELSHVYQYTLQKHGRFNTTHSEVRVIGPAWMQEGVAEFHKWAALAKADVWTYEQRRGEHIDRGRRVDVTLKETETYDGLLAGSGRFDLGALAAELLAAESSEAALIEFWTLPEPGTTWQQAFETAFGMTIEDFYTLFEAHRANGFPTVTLP